ncbi:MAG: anhydro-N-acetylmuramic acid kinase, partial [Crocinitomicaceae bacterium]
RQKDVVAGGHGAPLVPIGDKILFQNQADAFLNIGGFSNICIPGETTIAFDICPGNLPLNEIVNKIGLPYDANGDISRSGKINESALAKMNSLEFYQKTNQKSLGTEWLDQEFTPIYESIEANEDKLRTIIEHISIQISDVLNKNEINRLFITGGGAFNAFLIEEIQTKTTAEIILPPIKIIEFKEALVFAFLGLRFLRNEINCLSSVTGASRDTVGGVLHTP